MIKKLFFSALSAASLAGLNLQAMEKNTSPSEDSDEDVLDAKFLVFSPNWSFPADRVSASQSEPSPLKPDCSDETEIHMLEKPCSMEIPVLERWAELEVTLHGDSTHVNLFSAYKESSGNIEEVKKLFATAKNNKWNADTTIQAKISKCRDSKSLFGPYNSPASLLHPLKIDSFQEITLMGLFVLLNKANAKGLLRDSLEDKEANPYPKFTDYQKNIYLLLLQESTLNSQTWNDIEATTALAAYFEESFGFGK